MRARFAFRHFGGGALFVRIRIYRIYGIFRISSAQLALSRRKRAPAESCESYNPANPDSDETLAAIRLYAGRKSNCSNRPLTIGSESMPNQRSSNVAYVMRKSLL